MWGNVKLSLTVFSMNIRGLLYMKTTIKNMSWPLRIRWAKVKKFKPIPT